MRATQKQGKTNAHPRGDDFLVQFFPSLHELYKGRERVARGFRTFDAPMKKTEPPCAPETKPLNLVRWCRKGCRDELATTTHKTGGMIMYMYSDDDLAADGKRITVTGLNGYQWNPNGLVPKGGPFLFSAMDDPDLWGQHIWVDFQNAPLSEGRPFYFLLERWKGSGWAAMGLSNGTSNGGRQAVRIRFAEIPLGTCGIRIIAQYTNWGPEHSWGGWRTGEEFYATMFHKYVTHIWPELPIRYRPNQSCARQKEREMRNVREEFMMRWG